jgi:UDPglucose 6-dehydrogenase
MNYPSYGTDNIGIIGQGFVGTALREGLKRTFQIETYDKFKTENSTCTSLEELCEKTFILFLCLPTPMRKNGSCDLSIVEGAMSEIDLISKGDHIVVIKSTVPPGTTRKFNKMYTNIKVVFSPEFLTEANSINDFKNQTRIIVGGPRPASTIIKNMFRIAFPKIPIVKTGSNTAEMVKYFTNCVLATKVSFANEMKQICDKSDIDYDKVVEYALYDDRIGRTHLSTPGPDGSLGFGGSCFPKDINALIHHANESNVKPLVLTAVWNKNLEVRPERDWENLKGRAVSE